MPNETHQLIDWSGTLASVLSLDEGALTIDEIHILLDLARDAANGITRPASPVTAFLVGVAVGRGSSIGRAAAIATERILEYVPDQLRDDLEHAHDVVEDASGE